MFQFCKGFFLSLCFLTIWKLAVPCSKVKKPVHGFPHHEKFGLNFSSLSETILVPLWFIISLVFFYLSKLFYLWPK